MSNKNTGGPAFPKAALDPWNRHLEVSSGMTLRDYFAAKASEDDINEHVWKGHTEDFVTTDGYGNKTVIKRQAMWTREQAKYRYADAMIAAREAE